MGYIVAFLIFLVVVNIIGLIFSFLWPFILALILLVLIGNVLAYHKRKKQYEEFYKDRFSSQAFTKTDTTSSSSDDVIDVEFSEQEIDD